MRNTYWLSSSNFSIMPHRLDQSNKLYLSSTRFSNFIVIYETFYLDSKSSFVHPQRRFVFPMFLLFINDVSVRCCLHNCIIVTSKRNDKSSTRITSVGVKRFI